MNETICFRRFAGTNVEALLEPLSQLAPPGRPTFVLFWGPPEASPSDVEQILSRTPVGIPAIGTSTEGSFSSQYGDVGCDRWLAIAATSEYLTPSAGFGFLSQSTESEDDTIGPCVSEFIGMFDASEYFANGRDISHERPAAHGVKYRRPAFMLLFLPGIGAAPTPEYRTHWPVCDKDYQVLEAIAAYASRNLAVFGGSATPTWPPGGSQTWLAAKTVQGKQRILRSGIVGLLVECDLTFGCACAHGMELDPHHGHLVEATTNDWRVVEPPRTRESRPRRYHVVKVVESSDAAHKIELLDNPTTSDPLIAPILRGHREWRTLAVCDSDEVFPNPGYVWESGQIGLLRPVTNGTTLYQTIARREALLQAPGDATESAIEVGCVVDPTGVFFIN